jgi:hypothetical protein
MPYLIVTKAKPAPDTERGPVPVDEIDPDLRACQDIEDRASKSFFVAPEKAGTKEF